MFHVARNLYLRVLAHQRRLHFWNAHAARAQPMLRKRNAQALVAYYQRKIAELLAKHDLGIPL